MSDYEKLRQARFASLTDPVLKDYYAGLLKRRPLAELGVEGMRSRAGPVDPASLHDPDVVHEDAQAPGPHGPVPLRIFRRKDLGAGPHGIYVHTHGGGYVMGAGLDRGTAQNLRLAKVTNCIVVAVDFRVPPEAPFPIPLDDCFAAFRWTAANAQRLGGRPDRIAIGGGCTGANLATVTTLLARDAGGPMPAAQFLYAPLFDLRLNYKSYYENSGPGYSLTREDAEFVNRQYAQDWDVDRFDWRCSPVLAPSLRGMPPTYIHVGEWDVLRDESILYAARLRDAGCDVTLKVQPQQSHATTPVSAPELEAAMTVFLARTVAPGARRRPSRKPT